MSKTSEKVDSGSLRVVSGESLHIPGLGLLEPGITYNLPTSLAMELIARGIVQPYADILDGDQSTVHVVHVEDTVGVPDKMG